MHIFLINFFKFNSLSSQNIDISFLITFKILMLSSILLIVLENSGKKSCIMGIKQKYINFVTSQYFLLNAPFF